MRIRTIFLLIFLLLAGPWNAEAALPAGVSIHRLDNGMEVLMIRNPGLPMTGANVAVKVGSAYETFATSGMSHMLEHLLFNGTDSRTQKELYDDTDRIGGYNNANTSEYYTNYMMVTPREHFEKGLSIQADMLFHSTLPEKKFDKEKGIVLEEISKSLAEPREQLERNLISQIWRGHAMSLPTLGTYSTIKFMKRDDVYRFYKNNYVPNNMILSVVGDFDPAEMLGLINRIYGEQAASDILRPDHREWKTGPDATLPDTLPSGAVYRTYDGKELVTHDLFIPDGNLNPARIHLAELLLKEKTDPLFKTLDSEFPGMLKNVYLTLRTSPFRNFVEVKSVFQKGDHREKISRRIGELMKEMTLEIPSETLEKESLTSRTRYLQDIEKPHMFGIYNAHNFAVHGIGTVMDLYGGKEFGSAAEELKRVRFTGPLFTLIQSPAGPGDGEADSGETKTELFSDPAKGKSLLITENGGSELLAIHYLFKHKASLESKYGKDMARVLHHCFENRLKSPPPFRTARPLRTHLESQRQSILSHGRCLPASRFRLYPGGGTGGEHAAGPGDPEPGTVPPQTVGRGISTGGFRNRPDEIPHDDGRHGEKTVRQTDFTIAL